MIKIQEFEAVIFDMDGVLIDSEPLWKIAMEEAFHSVGCMITKKDFQQTVGLRIDEVVEYWHKQTGWKDLSAKEVEELIIQKMVRLIQENGDPLVGVLDTIAFLKERGIKVGLATSSYNILIDTVLEALGIKEAFDVVNSAEDEEFGKPHPAVYLTVANKLNVLPSKCLVIEDSLNGVIAGLSAKMKVVCIPEKTHTPEPKLMIANHHYETMVVLLQKMKENLHL